MQSVALPTDCNGVIDERPVTLGWVHRDYRRGNSCRTDGRITAIGNWEYAHADDLPALDIVIFLLAVRMRSGRKELGHVVRDVLASPGWTESDARLVALSHDGQPSATIGIDTVMVLDWLRQVASMIAQRSRVAEHGLCMHVRVHTELDALDQRSR